MRAAVANRKVFSGCPGRGIKTCQHDLYINVYGIYAVHKHTPIHTHTHTHTHYTYIRPYVMHMSVYFYVLTETHFECGVCASVCARFDLSEFAVYFTI